jgi:hypothetical protein
LVTIGNHRLTSDELQQLLLMLWAAATEQLCLRQRRKLRKAAAAAGSSSSSSSAAAAASAELPEPHHRQLFAALGFPTKDAARESDGFLKGPFMDKDGIYRIFAIASVVLMYKQEERVIEPLVRGGSCGGPAASRHWSTNGSSSGGGSVPPAVANLMRPLLLTAYEACLLDTPPNVISSCSEAMWLVLASNTWVPGGLPPGSSTAAAAAAAVQLRKDLGGSEGVQQLMQLMLQQVGPVVIAAHKRGKLAGVLRREDEAGAIKGHSRSVTIQGFGGALISLACSGGRRCCGLVRIVWLGGIVCAGMYQLGRWRGCGHLCWLLRWLM